MKQSISSAEVQLRIYTSNPEEFWVLEVSLGGRIDPGDYRIRLDPSMRLFHSKEDHIGRSDVVIADMQAEPSQWITVSELPQNVHRSSRDSTHEHHVRRALFGFVRDIPNHIVLWVVTNDGLSRKFEGINIGTPESLRHKLVEFMAAPEDRFLFSHQTVAPSMPYEVMADLLPILVGRPAATVWGTTWPGELLFWYTKPGVDFLARQIVALETGHGIPRRIAFAPQDLGVEARLASSYLAELEVQYKLGVDVRIVEPGVLWGNAGGTNRGLLCLGEEIGITYSNIVGSKSSEATALLGTAAQEIRDAYDPTQLSGVDLAVYLAGHPRTPELDSYVNERLKTIRRRVRQLRRRPTIMTVIKEQSNN